MAVLFAEGFTGVGRGSSSPVAQGSAFILSSLGWKANALYNGSSVVGDTDTNHSATVEADPIFATRNRLSAKATLVSAVSSYIQQYRMPLNTLGFKKFVIGMMFSVDSTTTTNGAFQFLVCGGNAWTETGPTAPNQYIGLNIPDNGGDGQAWMYWGAAGAATPLIKKGKLSHIELLIEQDVNRLRVYIDDVLIADGPMQGAAELANGGFSILLRTQATIVTTLTMKVSDVYMLGLDAVHTAKLGAAARVMEIAPTGDMDVHWTRPDGYASNAQVLSQTFNNTAPAYLAARDVGDYDIYNAPSSVAANAAKVFGVGMKLNAMTMAAGTHTVKPVIKSAAGVSEAGKESTLTFATPSLVFSDLSVNPDTNAIWTPAAISAAGIGYKLKS